MISVNEIQLDKGWVLSLYISIGWCKQDVTPVRQQWSYVFLALTHWYVYVYVFSQPYIWEEMGYEYDAFGPI